MTTTLKAAAILLALAATSQLQAQTLTLDSCRRLALRSDKALRIADEAVRGAGYEKRAAAAAYLPAIDASATYLYNQHKTSILSEDGKLPTMSFNPATGKYEMDLVTGADGMPVKDPATGSYIPSSVALLPKEAMEFDTRSVFAGAVTLTQPVFMGGEIRALNLIARYAEEALVATRDNTRQEVIFNLDQAYWTVVALQAKKELAQSFLQVVDTLHYDVEQMLNEGVATRADLLQVDVRLNEARILLTKVDNGLTLARMDLAQKCGLPIDSPIIPADTEADFPAEPPSFAFDMKDVYARRQDLNAVRKGISLLESKEKLSLGAMLPKLGIVGAYSFSTPNFINGFNRHVKGGFSIGAALTVPIWHWGGNYNRYRASKVATNAQRILLEDLEEKVELQVNQARFKMQEAYKTYGLAESSLTSARENLRCAQTGYTEGVLTTTDVLTAQTGWLQANSELIDAEIGIRLCNTYLSKVLGTLQ